MEPQLALCPKPDVVWQKMVAKRGMKVHAHTGRGRRPQGDHMESITILAEMPTMAMPIPFWICTGDTTGHTRNPRHALR